ncbi:MAG TPA: dipeptide epimerase [Rhizomicrobium sp.]|nr:dipeptide epimerase [Rhizomicrobium sp.]
MLALDVRTERWPFKAPFHIAGYVITDAEVVHVTLTQDGVRGDGEASGVFYRGETPETLAAQIESVRPAIEAGIARDALRALLPVGGARNALDCALWDLESKRCGRTAWEMADMFAADTIATTLTIGADTPARMAEAAERYGAAPRLKVKLTGEGDVDRLSAIRNARPEAWISVDANQAFTRAGLEELLPVLQALDIAMIEQPLPAGRDADLDGLHSPIPLAADESVQGLADVAGARGRFEFVNIKLDKCGGLTEALLMVDAIRAAGMRPMVGCMAGTSLAMIPGALLGQRCDIVDMDGAMFLARDSEPRVTYQNGVIVPPKEGWGWPGAGAKRRAAL